MDFKVCGTREGITGFQLDLKLPGISIDLLAKAMERNKIARMKILDTIQECIAAPREELNANAPRIVEIKINPEKIGALIGPGGKHIRAITAETESDINVEEDGTVKVMAADKEHMDEALRRIGELTAEVEVGQVYRGLVKGVREFGAFVEILPGQEGLLHISEMANYRVRAAEDICQEGDYVTVKVLDVDQGGKIRLSRRAALEEMES
jgi:polyribonucleotide nucleotidyltransferase